MNRRIRSGVSSIGAALIALLLLLAPACVTLRQKTRRAAPPALSPNEPLSSPQVTDRLPPPQPVPAEAVPAETLPQPAEPTVVAITPAPTPSSEPATPQPRPTTVRRQRPAAAAQPEISAPEPVHSDTAAAPPPQLRPMLTAAQERQLQLSINRSLLAAQQGLKRAAIPASDRERSASAARVRAFIEQAQQAVQQGDLNRARSLAERAELLASDLARSPR